MGSSVSVLARSLHAATRFPRLARLSKSCHVIVYKLTRGRVMGRWFGLPVLVLETVGRRSGKRRSVTVTYLLDGQRFVVLPINAGASRVPAWWLNLERAGSGTVLVRGKRIVVRPRVVSGEERAGLWGEYARQAPSIEAFRAYADREIPVVVLEREDADPASSPVSSGPAG